MVLEGILESQIIESKPLDKSVGVSHSIHSMTDDKFQQLLVVEQIATLWKNNPEWTLLEDKDRPPPFDKYPPDLVAQYQDAHPIAIAEVETALSLFKEDYNAWKEFSSIAPVTFYIFVPRGHQRIGSRILREQGITATLCTYSFEENLELLIDVVV